MGETQPNSGDENEKILRILSVFEREVTRVSPKEIKEALLILQRGGIDFRKLPEATRKRIQALLDKSYGDGVTDFSGGAKGKKAAEVQTSLDTLAQEWNEASKIQDPDDREFQQVLIFEKMLKFAENDPAKIQLISILCFGKPNMSGEIVAIKAKRIFEQLPENDFIPTADVASFLGGTRIETEGVSPQIEKVSKVGAKEIKNLKEKLSQPMIEKALRKIETELKNNIDKIKSGVVGIYFASYGLKRLIEELVENGDQTEVDLDNLRELIEFEVTRRLAIKSELSYDDFKVKVDVEAVKIDLQSVGTAYKGEIKFFHKFVSDADFEENKASEMIHSFEIVI